MQRQRPGRSSVACSAAGLQPLHSGHLEALINGSPNAPSGNSGNILKRAVTLSHPHRLPRSGQSFYRSVIWWLAYRLAGGCDFPDGSFGDGVLPWACKKCRYPFERLLMLRRDYPEAWNRMLEKRAHRLRGTNDPQSTDDRVSAASVTDAKCRHPRIARTIGWPYYGSYSKPRNYTKPLRAGKAPCVADAPEARLWQ